jgi:hypothetical protein
MTYRSLNMTTREALHRLIDDLPEEQAELARLWWGDYAMPPMGMVRRWMRIPSPL